MTRLKGGLRAIPIPTLFGLLLIYTTAYMIVARSLGASAILDNRMDSKKDEARLSQERPPWFAFFLEVTGTSIRVPVARAGDVASRDWFLTHDIWGNPDRIGCAYIDWRVPKRGVHLLVYGHNVHVPGIMFSDISGAYREDVFERIEGARILFDEGEEWSLTPLCALRVDASYQPIQRFSFNDGMPLGDWLMGLVGESEVRSSRHREEAARAKRVLTLVTCSEERRGMPYRTLVVFTSDR